MRRWAFSIGAMLAFSRGEMLIHPAMRQRQADCTHQNACSHCQDEIGADPFDRTFRKEESRGGKQGACQQAKEQKQIVKTTRQERIHRCLIQLQPSVCCFESFYRWAKWTCRIAVITVQWHAGARRRADESVLRLLDCCRLPPAAKNQNCGTRLRLLW